MFPEVILYVCTTVTFKFYASYMSSVFWTTECLSMFWTVQCPYKYRISLDFSLLLGLALKLKVQIRHNIYFYLILYAPGLKSALNSTKKPYITVFNTVIVVSCSTVTVDQFYDMLITYTVPKDIFVWSLYSRCQHSFAFVLNAGYQPGYYMVYMYCRSSNFSLSS
jgi:hypothetical protein